MSFSNDLLHALFVQIVALILYIAILVIFKPRMEKYAEQNFRRFHLEGFTKFLDYSIFALLLNYPVFGLLYVCFYVIGFSMVVMMYQVVLVE